ALASKALGQYKYCVHILETNQPPWAPKVVYVGALALRGGGQVGSALKTVGRGYWGFISAGVTAIIYCFFKDEIPRLPCRVAALSTKHDKYDLNDDQVDNSCKVGSEWVTFEKSGNYWRANTSKGLIEVKAHRSVALSLEDLVNSQFSIRKFREKSFGGYMEYTFADYNEYEGLGYELELITSPEEVQSNKEFRRSQRREARKQERAKAEAAVLSRAAEAVREADIRRLEEVQRKEVEAQRNKEAQIREAQEQREEIAQQRAFAQRLADTLIQSQASFFSERHEIVGHSYLSDDEIDYGLQHNTGSGFDAEQYEVIGDDYHTNDKIAHDLSNNTGSNFDLKTVDKYPPPDFPEGAKHEKTQARPSPAHEVLRRKLLHKHVHAYTLSKQVNSLQSSFQTRLQKASGYLKEWENIPSRDLEDLAQQAHLQNLHEKLSALVSALNYWQQNLSTWCHALNSWRNTVYQPGVQCNKQELANHQDTYQDNLNSYQAVTVKWTDAQTHCQALLQKLFKDHYYTTITTAQLRQQAISLAQSWVQMAKDAASTNAHALQKAEQACKKEKHRNEKLQDQLAIAYKKWQREHVETMAHTMDHQPLLDYLSGKGHYYINKQDDKGKTALWYAIKHNDPDMVRWLLDQRAEISGQDTDQCISLHWAAQWGYGSIAEAILDHDITVIEARDTYGFTPLHHAVDRGHEATAEVLIKHGAAVEAKNNWQETPLHRATMQGHTNTVALLLDHRAATESRNVDNRTPLYCATQQGHMSTVAFLLSRGAAIATTDEEGLTPLHRAAQLGYTNLIKLFLKYGAAVNAKDKIGFTPLHWAVQENNLEAIIILMDRGANRTISDNEGHTPLHCAVQQGHKATVKLLLSPRAVMVNAQDYAGCTPLHLAVQKNHANIVELLSSRGANIEIRDRDGHTPLHLAVQENHPVIVELLLMRGASINTRDNQGKTPWDVAKTQGYRLINPSRKAMQIKVEEMARKLRHIPLLNYLAKKGCHHINEKDYKGKTALSYAIDQNEIDIANWLVDHGADVEAKNLRGFTLLHQVVQRNHIDMVSLLLERGAETEVKDRQGRTPLHLAVAQSHTAIVELLLARGANVGVQDENGFTPFQLAIKRKSDPNLIRVLLKAGAKNNLTDTSLYLTNEPSNDCAPLHITAFQGDLDAVQRLLKWGNDIQVLDINQRTPLHFAVQQAHTDVVELLLTHGAKRQAKDKHGFTPLHYAVQSGYAGILKVLLYHVADIKKLDKNPFTLLHRAAWKGYKEIVELLLARRATINAKDTDGCTPLYWAKKNDHTAVVKLLLACGAQQAVSTVHEPTSSDTASKQNDASLAKPSPIKVQGPHHAKAPDKKSGYRITTVLLASDDSYTSSDESISSEDEQRLKRTSAIKQKPPTHQEYTQPEVSLKATRTIHTTPQEAHSHNLPYHKGLPNVGNTCYLNAGLQVIARLYPNLFSDKQDNTIARHGKSIIDKLTNQNSTEGVNTTEAGAFRDNLIQAYNVGKNPHDQLREYQQEDAAPVFNFLLEQAKAKELALYRTKVRPRGEYATTTNPKPSTGTALVLPAEPAPMSMDQLVAKTLCGERIADVIWEQDGQEVREEAVMGDKLSFENLQNLNNRILPIWVQRFGQTDHLDTGTAEKINTSITNPFSLTIPAEHLIEQRIYTGKLVGFIHHVGGLHGGHYTA
ncbi:MAG: hypothetical protein RL012_392, partial [Bacteroidota bacterium]